ncbi:MAG: hypothetical protein EA355_09650 [Rhodobacteraceae bacterium]|nr:MAG: hypothetical protein EA355_09650 [Paracoccaceae bacterium]
MTSRNSARKVLPCGETTFACERPETPMQKPGAFVGRLDAMLAANGKRAKRRRFRLTRVFDDMRRKGCGLGYVAVRRYAQRWPWRRRLGLRPFTGSCPR